MVIQRQYLFFLAPTHCFSALMHATHSSLSAADLLPEELVGEAETPSLPKTVLPLHFPAQAHWVHHCSACNRSKVMQAPHTCLHPAGKSPKETVLPVPTYTDQELPTFWLPMVLQSFICLF